MFRERGASGGSAAAHHTASTPTSGNTEGHEEQMKLEAVSYIESFIKGAAGGVPNSTEQRGGGGGLEEMIRTSRAK